MASKQPSSHMKQPAKGTGFNPMESPILSGQAKHEKTGAAKSGHSNNDVPTWGSYEKSAQVEKNENVSSQIIAKGATSKTDVEQSESSDPSVSQADKPKSKKTKKMSIKGFRKEVKKAFGVKSSHNATVTPIQDVSHMDDSQMEHQEDSGVHQCENNEAQILESRLDNVETKNSELQVLIEKANKDLVESDEALSRKEKLLEEALKSVEEFRKSRVVWEEIVESNKAEVGKLKERNHQLGEQVKEGTSSFNVTAVEMQDRKEEIENLKNEICDLKKKVEEHDSMSEKLDKQLQGKNAEVENVRRKNEELEKKVKEGQLKSENLDKELLETKAALQEKSNKVIATLENASRSSSEASKKIESLQDQLSQRTAEVTNYKDKLQQLTGRDSEVTLLCKALQKEVNEKDGKLRLLAIELEEEKQKQRKSGLELDHVRQEQCQKHVEEKQKLANCEESLLTAQNGAEKLRSQLQTLEREKEMWSTKHTEEISILKNRISELDQKLKVNTIALEHVIVKPLDTRPLLSPGKDTSGQELHLAPQNVAAKRSKSQLHLQSENLGEHHFEAFVHSSAPSSLKKDNYSATADNQDVDTQEQEVNRYNAYESPHTSLTEVAGKVTVSFLSIFQIVTRVT